MSRSSSGSKRSSKERDVQKPSVKSYRIRIERAVFIRVEEYDPIDENSILPYFSRFGPILKTEVYNDPTIPKGAKKERNPKPYAKIVYETKSSCEEAIIRTGGHVEIDRRQYTVDHWMENITCAWTESLPRNISAFDIAEELIKAHMEPMGVLTQEINPKGKKVAWVSFRRSEPYRDLRSQSWKIKDVDIRFDEAPEECRHAIDIWTGNHRQDPRDDVWVSPERQGDRRTYRVDLRMLDCEPKTIRTPSLLVSFILDVAKKEFHLQESVQYFLCTDDRVLSEQERVGVGCLLYCFPYQTINIELVDPECGSVDPIPCELSKPMATLIPEQERDQYKLEDANGDINMKRIVGSYRWWHKAPKVRRIPV